MSPCASPAAHDQECTTPSSSCPSGRVRLVSSGPVLGTAAHQFAGSLPNEGQDATLHLRRGSVSARASLDDRTPLIRHGGRRGCGGARRTRVRALQGPDSGRSDIPHGIRGVTLVERPVQREQRLAVVVACRRSTGFPPVGEGGSHVRRRNTMTQTVTETRRPPLQLLAATRPRAVADPRSALGSMRTAVNLQHVQDPLYSIPKVIEVHEVSDGSMFGHVVGESGLLAIVE